MLRLTPQLFDAEVTGSTVPRDQGKGKLAQSSWTMHGRVTAAEETYRTMFAWSDASPLNQWKGGILGAGSAPGDSRLVTVNPVPARAAAFLKLNEYGRSFARDHRTMHNRIHRDGRNHGKIGGLAGLSVLCARISPCSISSGKKECT